MSNTLYHGTSREKAEVISKCGYFKAGTFMSNTRQISESFAEVMFEMECSDEFLWANFDVSQYGNISHKNAKQYVAKHDVKLEDVNARILGGENT